ncbi:MAG: sensor domain-containing protein [Proteobacteria bacterium]|nr:sensor domain-containing protein [Pseudomonadota bacterium]
MNTNAPRTIEEYLRQLREALAGQDPALIQDALYDAEEHIRSEVRAHPDKSEGDVLELIASTYGAPEEVAAAYRDTEVKVKAALATPAPSSVAQGSALRRFFGIFQDPRAYTSLFYMLLALVTGIIYFTIVVTGLSLSAGFAILIIGIPFFLAFIGVVRVLSLGEGRLLEAMTGERMPRRPVHPGPPAGWGTRILDMLKDPRTWTTQLYLLLMLPLGVVYFVVAIVGLSVGLRLALAPLLVIGSNLGWPFVDTLGSIEINDVDFGPQAESLPAALIGMALGVLILALTLHLARSVVRGHARMAKSLLVMSGS